MYLGKTFEGADRAKEILKLTADGKRAKEIGAILKNPVEQ